MSRRSPRDQLAFVYSPRGAFILSATVGVVTVLAAVEPIVSLIAGGKLNLVGNALLGVAFVAVALFITYSILKDRELHKELAENHQLREENALLRRQNGVADDERRLLTTGFRDLARFRAAHSAQLYAIQKYILRASDPKQVNGLFLASWALEKSMLDNVCDFTAGIFTRMKGVQCCVNIKALIDPKYEKSSLVLLRTHYGVAKELGFLDSDVPYETISRCSNSKRQARKEGTAKPNGIGRSLPLATTL